MEYEERPVPSEETPETDEERQAVKLRRKRLFRLVSILLVFLVILVVSLLIRAHFKGEYDSVEALQEYIRKFGVFGPLFLVLFQACLVLIPVFPSFPGCAAGTVLFGPAVAFWCNYVGLSAGSILAFMLAKKYGMPLLEDLFPTGKYKKWEDWASRSKSYTAFLLMAMILPFFPDHYLCYLTGVSKMPLKRFLWIIILGKPWVILAYCLGFSLIR